jgi:hypothetical protein
LPKRADFLNDIVNSVHLNYLSIVFATGLTPAACSANIRISLIFRVSALVVREAIGAFLFVVGSIGLSILFHDLCCEYHLLGVQGLQQFSLRPRSPCACHPRQVLESKNLGDDGPDFLLVRHDFSFADPVPLFGCHMKTLGEGFAAYSA